MSGSVIRIGLFSGSLDGTDGYPRDFNRLILELNEIPGVRAIPIRTARELIACRLNLDLLHLMGIFIWDVQIASRLATKFGLPYVCSPLANLLPLALQRSALKKRLFLKVLARSYLNSAVAVHAFTEKERESLRLLGVTRPTLSVPCQP
jgi:hypothetical protein